MTNHGLALFDTLLGSCGIAWGPDGILAVQLPEARANETRARLLRRCPDAVDAVPPPAVQRAIDGITALLGGERRDLADIVLDMARVPEFNARVYEVARAIPPGQTLTYGAVAARLGDPGAAREVGQALGRNPFAPVIPCHRVLAADGKHATGGVAMKRRLLEIEGAEMTPVSAGPIGFLEDDADPGFDPVAAVAQLRAADPRLARLIDRVGPFRMEPDSSKSLFGALALAIIHLKLGHRQAAASLVQLRGLFPKARDVPTAEQILYAEDERLLATGFSRAVLATLRDLAKAELPTLAELRPMSDQAILERLEAVGRPPVEWLLRARLGRADVLSTADAEIRRGFALLFDGADVPDMAGYAERWRPYRSVADWYLRRAVELSR
jgi:methylated-DNA-[protein]-cysteine S-methyltransferase